MATGLGIAAALVVILFAAIAATVSVPNQAAVGIIDGMLVIRPIGLMRLWALSTGVTVDLSAIAEVGVVDRRSSGRRYWRPGGIRSPGAYLPGFICAGTYRRKGAKELWMVGRASEAVDIELADGQGFTRVVLQVEDPAGAVAAIRAKLGS